MLLPDGRTLTEGDAISWTVARVTYTQRIFPLLKLPSPAILRRLWSGQMRSEPCRFARTPMLRLTLRRL